MRERIPHSPQGQKNGTEEKSRKAQKNKSKRKKERRALHVFLCRSSRENSNSYCVNPLTHTDLSLWTGRKMPSRDRDGGGETPVLCGEFWASPPGAIPKRLSILSFSLCLLFFCSDKRPNCQQEQKGARALEVPDLGFLLKAGPFFRQKSFLAEISIPHKDTQTPDHSKVLR